MWNRVDEATSKLFANLIKYFFLPELFAVYFPESEGALNAEVALDGAAVQLG